MASHTQFGTVKDAARELRKAVPPDKPVKVVRKDLTSTDDTGYCIYTKKAKSHKGYYTIVVCKSLPENTAVLILLHEWAHCLAWHKEGSDHGPQWGICYARVWRLYIQESEKESEDEVQ